MVSEPTLAIEWEPNAEKNDPHEWKSTYSLLIPAQKWDIRQKDGVVRAVLGETTVRFGHERGPIEEDGSLYTPFRDGVHVNLDRKVLGFPAIVICGDRKEPIPVFEPKS